VIGLFSLICSVMKYSRPSVHRALYRGFRYTVAVIMSPSTNTYCNLSVACITQVQKLSPETCVLSMVHCIVYGCNVAVYHDLQPFYHPSVALDYNTQGNFRQYAPGKEVHHMGM
jgi:hypothetical protein